MYHGLKISNLCLKSSCVTLPDLFDLNRHAWLLHSKQFTNVVLKISSVAYIISDIIYQTCFPYWDPSCMYLQGNVASKDLQARPMELYMCSVLKRQGYGEGKLTIVYVKMWRLTCTLCDEFSLCILYSHVVLYYTTVHHQTNRVANNFFFHLKGHMSYKVTILVRQNKIVFRQILFIVALKWFTIKKLSRHRVCPHLGFCRTLANFGLPMSDDWLLFSALN